MMRNLLRAILVKFAAILAPAAEADEKNNPALATAMEMVDAWNTLDVDRIVGLFAEDGSLHSVMMDPIVGRPALKEHLNRLLEGATRLKLELINVAVTGNTVFLERIDDFDYRGKHGRLPVVGVLEIEDGRVKIWREYYDRAALMTEMGIAAGGGKADH